MNPLHNRPRRTAAVILALILLPRFGHGMQFSLGYDDPVKGHHFDTTCRQANGLASSNPNRDCSYLLMQGEILPGDYQRLLAFAIHSNSDLTRKQIILSSPGGDVAEALKIGKLIKGLYTNVWVNSWSGPCASACFIIYASAVERLAGVGIVGIHRPYISHERVQLLSPADAEALETRALLDAEEYLHKMRVPNNLVDAMFERASNEIHWLSADELYNQLGRRPPWYEELLIARCGLGKDSYRHIGESNNADNESEVAVLKCAHELTRPEAVKNFAKALAPTHTGFRDDAEYYGFYELLSPPQPWETLAPEELERCRQNPKSCGIPDSFLKPTN